MKTNRRSFLEDERHGRRCGHPCSRQHRGGACRQGPGGIDTPPGGARRRRSTERTGPSRDAEPCGRCSLRREGSGRGLAPDRGARRRRGREVERLGPAAHAPAAGGRHPRRAPESRGEAREPGGRRPWRPVEPRLSPRDRARQRPADAGARLVGPRHLHQEHDPVRRAPTRLSRRRLCEPRRPLEAAAGRGQGAPQRAGAC